MHLIPFAIKISSDKRRPGNKLRSLTRGNLHHELEIRIMKGG